MRKQDITVFTLPKSALPCLSELFPADYNDF